MIIRVKFQFLQYGYRLKCINTSLPMHFHLANVLRFNFNKEARKSNFLYFPSEFYVKFYLILENKFDFIRFTQS